jgi:dTDP-4-amino-4,6-dideoxygalactose transaminase
VFSHRIPVFSPCLGIDTLKHLTDALELGWLGMGAITKTFEEHIAAYLELQDRFVVCTNTGTSAIHIALRAAGIGEGDEVITTSFNYVADHQAVCATGAQVVMCDIRSDDLGIDIESARKLITKRTKAIIPLHFAGIPCRINDVYTFAQEYGLRVIEDACHAFGTKVNDKKIGSFGDMQFFSFDPVKIITSIDGGCVVTPQREEYEQLQKLRLLGVDKDTTLRYQNKRAWDYDVVSEGYRYHLTNIMASVGVSQILRIEEFITNRQKICKQYSDSFASLSKVKTLDYEQGYISPFIYSLRVPAQCREEFIAYLDERGIDTGIHFVPVHRHTYFRSARRCSMPVTNQVVQEVVTLPLHSMMTQEDISRVIDSVLAFFS